MNTNVHAMLGTGGNQSTKNKSALQEQKQI